MWLRVAGCGNYFLTPHDICNNVRDLDSNYHIYFKYKSMTTEREWLLSLDIKTKVIQQVFQVFHNIPGSQLLSDVQTLFARISAKAGPPSPDVKQKFLHETTFRCPHDDK